MKRILFILLIPFLVFAQNNYSLNFDGDDYVEEVVADWRGSDESGTVSFWFNISDLSGTGGAHIFTSSDEVLTTRWWANYVFLDNDEIEQGSRTPGILDLHSSSTTSPLTTGKWYNVIVWSNGSTISCEIDGVAQTISMRVGINQGTWMGDIIERDNITIGIIHDSGFHNGFTGLVDEIRYFKTVLSSAQKASLYNNGTPNANFDTTGTGQIFYCNFEEGQGTSTTDQIGGLVFDFGAGAAAPSWSTNTAGWQGGNNNVQFSKQISFSTFRD